MTLKKDIKIIRKQTIERKDNENYGMATIAVKKLTTKELCKMMKDIKHIHIKNSIKTEEVE